MMIIRRIYTTTFYLALPFILLRAAWRTRGSNNQLKKLAERLGIYTSKAVPDSIWLHAVSYGEAVAAEPLIKQLRSAFPKQMIVVTTMTLTGAQRIESIFKTDKLIRHHYLPYDVPYAINHFFDHVKPKLGIIIETELWPNILFLAGKRKLPLFIANARLSQRSYKGYQRIAKFMSPLLQNLSYVGAQSPEDAERFKKLGVAEDKVSALGNLKFDIDPPSQQLTAAQELRRQLPFDNILVAASTHFNEEELIIDLFIELKKQFPASLLILVPRHPERFDEVAALCAKKGFRIGRRSSELLPTRETPIYLGDSMGELYFYYSLADVAFVGGSLVPVGGHNLLEPAAIKRAIITGPHLSNFDLISTLLRDANALHVGSTKEELLPIFRKLLADKDYRNSVAQAGFEILAKNQGATSRHVTVINELLA